MRTVMTCAALSLALFADAAPSILLEGGYVSPVAGDVRVPLEGRETILRGKNTLLMYSVGGEPLVATLRNVGVGSYRDIVTYTLSGPGGEALAEGELARGGETEVRVDRPSAGIHRLEIDTRNNSCTVSSAVKYTCAQASQGAPLSLVYYTRRLYFFVPPDARHFTVHVSGSGPAEHVVATVLGPGDEQVARETTIGKPESTCSIGVDVAEGQDGRAWSVVLSKTPEFIIEDCGISLSGDVVPFVADHPARLAVPLISLFARRAENETQVGVRLNAGAAALAGMKARLQVSEVGNPEPLYEQTHTSPGPGEIVARVTGPELRVCTLAARLVNREDEPVLEYRRFFLAGDVAPSFADDAASAVEPLASVFARESGQQAEVGVRLNAGPAALAGMKLHLQVFADGKPEPIHDQVHTPLATGEVVARVAGKGLTMCIVAARLLGRDDQAIATLNREIATAYGALFQELKHVEERSPPAPTKADEERGYQVFTRSEPGDIRPTSRPKPGEIVSELRVAAAPSEFEPASFAVYPLRDLPKARLVLSDLAGPDGATISASAVDVRVARCWPQRTNWNSTTFHVVPELLERRKTVDLEQGEPQQFYMIVRVPDDCPSGEYGTTVRLRAKGRVSEALSLNVEVLPFTLREPPGIVFGLYPDTARWKSFSAKQIEREMIDFREHGINALMLYPLTYVDFSYAEGKVAADFTRFREHMDLYRKVGLGGPMVISVQGGEPFVKQLIGAQADERTPEFIDAYRQMLALLHEESIENQWPPHCLHSVDEPSGGNKGEAVVETLKLAKDAGFETFNTCYRDFVRNYLDPYLDFRCYNNIAFGHMRTPESTAELREETLAAGDHFWWYGSGCYTNGGFIQDGNVIANRFMTGFHLWRTGATGAWSWTFLRPKDDPYDDFDGASQGEAKDACIAYPTPDGKALVPTLQWEGIREGIDDYRYLYTLQALIDEAKASDAPRAVAAATKAQTALTKLLDEMPWLCTHGQFTNGDANRARQEVIRLALEVGASMSQ